MKLVALSLAGSLVVGCVAPAADDDATDPQHPGQPQPEPPQPAKPTATGTYRVHSELDLTVDALLPEAIHAKVVLLRQFSQNPAQTLFDVAEDAGVPAVEDIRDALPSVLEDKLYGWMNDEIANLTINGVSVTQHAANIAALAETSLGTFAIDSTLVINGSTATHTLATLDLSPAGLPVTFPLSALPSAAITATAPCISLGGTFAMGFHSYAIPYGEYVWQALNAQLDIRASLGTAINCPALANTIANKCVFGACVGHKAQLTEICERGLDEVVERIHDEFTATKLDLLQLDAGSATLSADGNAMTAGTWAAEVNAGQGLRSAPATFTATR